MVRLQPCPSCGRHIRVSDRACPFCLASFAPAPGRLSIALLGLALVACAGGTEAPNKTDDKAPAKADEVKPPETTTAEPTTAIEPPVEPPPVEPPSAETGAEPEADTTAAPEPENESAGTTDGSTIEDKPEVKKPPQKTKYGAPRPAKKYGGPPMPGPEDEPF